MVEKSGVRIGVIGAIGDCYTSIAAEQVEDVYFLVGDDLTELVKAESTKLREYGADVIVYVLHDSGSSYGSYYDTTLSKGYVDVVFEGHTHQKVHKQDAFGVWHLQAGGDNNMGLSHVTLDVNTVAGTVDVSTAEIVYKSSYEYMADDPIVDQLLKKYESELSRVNEVLGENDYERDYDSLAAFMAEAMYLAGEERWGDDEKYNGKIVLGGGYINVRSPYYLPAGKVTYGDIYPLFTFDNPLVLCEVKGDRLKSQFINSDNYVCYYGEDGSSIKNNVDRTATYYVVVDTYCANYDYAGKGFLEIVEYYDDARQFFSRDALAKFIKEGGMTTKTPDIGGDVGDGDGVDDETYTSIREIHASGSAWSNVTAKGEVIAVSKTSFLLSDGTGIIMYYTGSAPTVAVGDRMEVTGATTIYNNNQQFKSGATTYTLKDVNVPQYTPPTPAEWDNDDVESFDGYIGDYVKMEISLYLTSSGYYNAEKLSGNSARVVSVIAPADDVLGGIVITSTAQKVVVTGYPCYINSGRYFNILIDTIRLAENGGGNENDGTMYELSLSDGQDKDNLTGYSTGNYGEYSVGNVTLEYYRAYADEYGSEYVMELLPYFSSASDGTLPGALYNVTPIYGMTEIEITYKSSSNASVYVGDDRAGQAVGYYLPSAASYTTKTVALEEDNFFKIESGSSGLYIKELTVSYTNETVSYTYQKNGAGDGETRLNAVTHSGGLVAGQTSVSVPVEVAYSANGYQILQTKTYTYYTLSYVKANPSLAEKAAMTEPADIAAYYAAFGEFPANFAASNCDGNSFSEVKAVFGDDTRYVSKYSRTNGYAQHVPYSTGNTTYYEFDVALDASYWENGERGVGRVVAWEGGWDATGYNDAPVAVYTDDHYATFQEYLNDGSFGVRFDAEMNLTFAKWSAPTTMA